jgi:hypothetical protein
MRWDDVIERRDVRPPPVVALCLDLNNDMIWRAASALISRGHDND